MAGGDDTPPVNAARVAEIRQAIAEGRFAIDPGAIADRLINSARELLQGQRKA
jgi:negative regulator of flagellin synthesis FlgM